MAARSLVPLVVVALGLSLATSAFSQPQPLTSTELIAFCEGNLGTVDAQCWSYLLGIIDGLTVGESRTGMRFICSPSEITTGIARLIFLKWASEHPASLLSLPASYAVATSLEAAFPCHHR
jgi:Rap1a immunity proteins